MTENKSIELKPCPFCGRRARFSYIVNQTSEIDVALIFKIKCMKCGVELPQNYKCEVYMDQDGGIRTGKDERQKAVEDWNRRTNDGKTD